jgi:hypothetical protein
MCHKADINSTAVAMLGRSAWGIGYRKYWRTLRTKIGNYITGSLCN